jgi:hypothetical protein
LLSLETYRENPEAIREGSYGRFVYNWFRTYDPHTGRYLEGDPTGAFDLLGSTTASWYAATQSDDAIALPPTPDIGGTLSDGPSVSPRELLEIGVLNPQEANPYQYSFNDPTNAFDPDGLRVNPKKLKQAACGGLRATVTLCKASLRRCRGGESCIVLRAKQAAFTSCAAARYSFSRFCKGGPNPGHRKAIASWKGAAARCGRLAKQAGCACLGS